MYKLLQYDAYSVDVIGPLFNSVEDASGYVSRLFGGLLYMEPDEMNVGCYDLYTAHGYNFAIEPASEHDRALAA